MHIRFERTGGLANIPLAADVDVDQLAVEDQDHVRRLVEGSRFFELPASIEGSAGGVDRFRYRIAIVEGSHVHAIDVEETGMPLQLRPLVQWLAAAARRR